MPRFNIRYDDPDGDRYGTPTFGWRTAPEGLATKRQLRAKGLRPGGQPVAAQLGWRSNGEDKFAALYRIDQAKPVRPMTPAKWAAITAALRARRVCPDCGCEQDYEIPRRFGACNDCAGDTPPPPEAPAPTHNFEDARRGRRPLPTKAMPGSPSRATTL